jgi:hypothetical protein
VDETPADHLDLTRIEMQPHFRNGEYHSPQAYVYVGAWALEQDAIWLGVDNAECLGIELDQIGRALSHNWSATAVALAFRNIATLRALISEASEG